MRPLALLVGAMRPLALRVLELWRCESWSCVVGVASSVVGRVPPSVDVGRVVPPPVVGVVPPVPPVVGVGVPPAGVVVEISTDV